MGWVWDRFAILAEAAGTKTAIHHGKALVSFADLFRAAEGVASTLPIATGDRVVVSAENSIGFVTVILAIWRLGGVPTVINVNASAEHKAHTVAKTDARLVFTDGQDVPGAENRGVPTAFADDTEAQLPDHGCTGDDPASIIFTSGSTGAPKGVVQLAKTLTSGADRMSQLFGLIPQDRILCPVPFSFDYGWGQLMSLTQGGIPLVLPEPRNGFGICSALSAHNPTVMASQPAVMADLLMGLAPFSDTPKESLRLLTSTGSKIPNNVFDLMLEHFPNVEISLNYGMTETFRSASLPPSMAKTARHSVGYPVPGVELRIVDEKGNDVPQGTVGEVIHIGEGAFEAYWDEPEQTAKTRFVHTKGSGPKQPAVYTGDFGYFDEEGRLCLEGRRDRQVKCMGVRISLDEIEAALEPISDLKELAVTVQPHDMLGAIIRAHVVPKKDGIEEKAFKKRLNAFCRLHLSPFMQPRIWDVRDALPRNLNGKIDYVRLRSE